MSISIKNLSKQYGTQQVLRNINLEIGEGKIAGFLGPNGAGKTTTMRIIAGALDYESGSVEVCGLQVKNNPLATKKLIGYLPEQNPLYSDMYVKEYLMFVAEIYKIDQRAKKVDEIIDKLGLRPEFRKKIGQLSKGYRQHVGLAHALIHNPKVLILDEPTTGLDPNQIEEIRALIREIGKDKTVLFSTHIMQEIKALCNRVIIINKGEIVADYPDISNISVLGENLLYFETGFLQKTKKDDLQKIDAVQSLTEKANNCFEIAATADIRANLFDFAVQTDNKILTLKQVERSVEEVFRILTAEESLMAKK